MRPTAFEIPVEQMPALPDHTQLPDTDGSISDNSLAHSQSNRLTGSLRPKLLKLHPDGQFFVASDVGIYFRFTEPVLAGCKSPDWYYVPGVGQMLNGRYRRSYVLWKEVLKPCLVIEFVSGDGSEEHDRTPDTGKFWVYERAICADYYAIYDVQHPSIELYRLVNERYQGVPANANGRYPVPPMDIELGLWKGHFHGVTAPWLRAWDAGTGKMLTIAEEGIEDLEAGLEGTRELLDEQVAETEKERKRADKATKRANQQAVEKEKEGKRADEATKRAEQLAAKMRALGIDPEA